MDSNGNNHFHIGLDRRIVITKISLKILKIQL